MRTLLSLLLFVISATITQVSATTDKNTKPFVIPELREWKGNKGTFDITTETRIVYPKNNSGLAAVAAQFAADYKKMFGVDLPIAEGTAKRGDIALTIKKDKKLGNEGYTIKIGNKVEIAASTTTGVFWATRTILQMTETGGRELPQGTIRDWPDYAMRGFMLDCGRKYIPIEFLREYIEFMAYYKMNTFQIHLNDNGFKQFFGHDWSKTQSAFRLESEYFPGLTARDGYYTKQEFIDLQKLAEGLFVEIIPEIDVPAHSLAFTKYRPEIGSKEYGVDHLDLFKEETYQFVDSLFDEYLKGESPVFCGKRVHVGTDEYSNRDKAVVEQFRHFTNHCLTLVEGYGKQAMAWGALTHAKGDTPVKVDNIILSAWYNGYADPAEMIKLGYDLVSIPDGYLYIVPAAGYYYDYLNCQMLYENWTPAQIGNQKFDERHPQIKGGMFAVWNDHPGNGISCNDIHYRVYPAMQTLAVKMWTGAEPKLPYEQFDSARTRLSDAPGININGRYNGTFTHTREIVKSGETNELKNIGHEYSVSFTVEAAKEQKGTVLYCDGVSTVYLCDPIEGKIGFSRDGYLNTFNYSLFPGEKARITISGDRNETKLYIDGKLIETLAKKTLYFNEGGKDKMYYTSTLVFPLAKAGNFMSKVSNLIVVNKKDNPQ